MECNTDKATFHKFCDFYDEALNHLRKNDFNLLEIGVYHGESLRMWKSYFKKAMIFAIDIDDMSTFDDDRIVTAICDQASRTTLCDCFADKTFGMIIDDGGHKMDQQQISFASLFGRLSQGGIYVIEDLHTSLWPGYRDNKPYSSSTLHMLEHYEKKKVIESEYMTAEEMSYLNENISSVEIFRRTDESITSIIIKK